ncbi:DUF2939 domain-containing protein [Duganella sp. S19_KUP01_CR8]|uniref:DUF2939 domain-containing protein n=1 Tax=Duganella sp. S19_KUP01_CR8 TaxID=3025502 RepID=UPI002FCD7DFA
MKKLTLSAVAVVTIALVITFGSPYIALYQIRTAVAERDADAISDHVDFPALRENLKGQVMGGMMAAMDTPELKSNPFAGVGQALGAAMVGPMIDTLVSPAGLIALMQRSSTASDTAAGPSAASEKPNYKLSFKGWSKVILQRADTDGSEGALTLRRFGLWNWKLTSIEIPADAWKR